MGFNYEAHEGLHEEHEEEKGSGFNVPYSVPKKHCAYVEY